MYSNGGGLGIAVPEKSSKPAWRPKRNETQHKKNKCFVRCLCPKCNILHNVYMLWTGRGVPRKYCANCKPLISGYDEAVIYEVVVSTPAHSRKKRRCGTGD